MGQCGRQLDVRQRHWERAAEGPMCRPGSDIFCFLQQQAIEDLQGEEEKVILLTKEKTKLQMQAEDVSSSCVSTQNIRISITLCWIYGESL